MMAAPSPAVLISYVTMTHSTNASATAQVVARLRAILAAQLNSPDAGLVLCDIAKVPENLELRASTPRVLVDFAQGQGATLDAARLVEMPREMASRIARELFRGPLVGPAVRTRADAHGLASMFLDHFCEDARFYYTLRCSIDTKHDLLKHTGFPLLGTSMELGFFAIDSSHVGCLIVGDED